MGARLFSHLFFITFLTLSHPTPSFRCICAAAFSTRPLEFLTEPWKWTYPKLKSWAIFEFLSQWLKRNPWSARELQHWFCSLRYLLVAWKTEQSSENQPTKEERPGKHPRLSVGGPHPKTMESSLQCFDFEPTKFTNGIADLLLSEIPARRESLSGGRSHHSKSWIIYNFLSQFSSIQ